MFQGNFAKIKYLANTSIIYKGSHEQFFTSSVNVVLINSFLNTGSYDVIFIASICADVIIAIFLNSFHRLNTSHLVFENQ